MSRLSFNSEVLTDTKVYFGLDCAGTPFAGYFVTIHLDGDNEPLLELDTRPGFTPRAASRGVILDTLEKHGCPQIYLDLIAMDLDPDLFS